MWFKVEQARSSTGQKFAIRCNSEIAGKAVIEERLVKGVTEARKTAEILASSLNVTATVYGSDADGEFVYGVYEVSEGAAVANDPLIKKLYAESAAASLTLRDQLLAEIPEDTIKGFATMAAALGYIVAQHKQIKRSATPQIGYSTLFRIFCGGKDPSTLSLSTDDATIAILTRKLADLPGWMWLSELPGLGSAERKAVIPAWRPDKVTLTIDGELQVIRPRSVFRGTVPETGAQFMLVVQMAERRYYGQSSLDSVGLIYHEQDEAAVVALVRQLLRESTPFKGRVVLINRDLRTVRSRMSDRSWNDVIPHEQARGELDFIAASIRNRDMLKAEGLSIRRGLLLSGPPGDGKSTAIECFVNDIAGEATILIVEAVEHIRSIYHLAQTLAPAVVILEDLDLMTKSRQNPYAGTNKDDVTGELLQVLSGGSAYDDIITIATTNHPEAIDEALAKRAGRFDAHIRMGYPSDDDKRRILELYLDRFAVTDELTRRRLQQTLTRDFGRLHLVPAHIEEFVKAGIKRARLAQRPPEYLDFEPGIEATKSIATQKPATT
ncbi:ATP-binding protein [uncultured Bradyrhizobium sp.]|jgi:AAA+ superfamily predicted ATPase|uniref:ATP-binding protein n=1 Tax=uncultured Bradyrhizobium sp. TaxID=199684 RepID=UPI002601A117|nr:ATP-binding protein [uncultured Bradyrhizobium sp.]